MNIGSSHPAAAQAERDESAAQSAFVRLRNYLTAQIIGQQTLVERLLIVLLADGHLLVEGPPGLAKTRAIKALAHAIEGDFQRVQFTPDLLPADLTGSDIYRPEEGAFRFQRGPLFHNLILADEINRAPAKVQSALLEAMAERQISVGDRELRAAAAVPGDGHPEPDRAGRHLSAARGAARSFHAAHAGRLPRPRHDPEDHGARAPRGHHAAGAAAARAATRPGDGHWPRAGKCSTCTLAEPVAEYIAALVDATRRPEPYSAHLGEWLRWGASPRAAIAIERGARAVAWLDGRDYVSPEDVQDIAPDALRHRLLLDYGALARGVTAQACVEELLGKVPAP